MTKDRASIAAEMQTHFEGLWAAGDPWDLETSDYEEAKYARQFALLNDRRYRRTLEIGCGSGRFTRLLARIADHVDALDIAPSAIERARLQADSLANVDFRVANIMEHDLRTAGPWDLIVMSETLPCLGWLYPFFEIGTLAAELFAATSAGGRLLMVNVFGGSTGPLFRPWLIHTYRDLFLHVGYRLELEELFRATKDGTEIDALVSLFFKASEDAEEREHALW